MIVRYYDIKGVLVLSPSMSKARNLETRNVYRNVVLCTFGSTVLVLAGMMLNLKDAILNLHCSHARQTKLLDVTVTQENCVVVIYCFLGEYWDWEVQHEFLNRVPTVSRE